MLGERYVVCKGDNLWRIAAATLGRGKEWPRIWHYNNRREVARVTGRKIPNPDRIYIGQLLYIPRLSTIPVVRDPASASPTALRPAEGSPTVESMRMDREPKSTAQDATPLSDQLRNLRIPLMFRFRLGELSWPPQDVGTAVIQIRMSGEVLLKTRESYPATLIASREDLEVQMSREANHAFGKLVGEHKFAFDPSSKKVTVSSMLISQSSAPNTVATAVGIEMSSDSPLPKLKAEIKLPSLQGTISGFEYVAVDSSISIEITPRPSSSNPASMRKETPESSLVPIESPTPWLKLVGTGLVIGAVGLLVVNAVEDFATGGLGLANDPIVFAVSGALLAKGLANMGVGASGMPHASAPARVELKASFVLTDNGRI